MPYVAGYQIGFFAVCTESFVGLSCYEMLAELELVCMNHPNTILALEGQYAL